METEALRRIGLADNEIKIYIVLLRNGSLSAYEIGKKTGIYRAHIYDKLEKLMEKGLVTHVYKGAKKFFQATSPEKIKQYLEEKKRDIEYQEEQVNNLLPELLKIASAHDEDTRVEVFKGIEGIKYFLRDIVKTGKDVMITGVDDAKYDENLRLFISQYFRDLRNKKIKERIITLKKKDIFTFDKSFASTTTYKFLDAKQFNPTNTYIYASKVVLVVWGAPPTAIMIENTEIAETYKDHFEHLWKLASVKNE
ncbi:MAG: helix-turn-helix domain-containing protein [Candidatus Aenigmarchaeota archaeon]|nr:helix-turn-helix domain-containing protein [Candidatus Aenigmarchaeota archaeon]